ncbi:MAG: glycosyltransferase family 39 protein [Acetatifactor sp.]
MNWKKNYFSYAVWFIYTFITGFCLLALVSTFRLPVWQTAGLSTLIVVLGGPLVLLLHKISFGKSEKDRRIVSIAVEILMVLLIAAAGIFLRVLKFSEAGDSSFYFNLASLEAGKKIPQIAQGAVYFYLQILREVFFFFGNNMTAALVFQTVVQTAAFLVLYFAVRQMTGTLPALIMLALCEFSGYMTESALRLSPDCLYLLFWAVSLIWISSIHGEKTDPIEFIPVGIFTALMGYTDVMGFLLFVFAIAAIFRAKEEKQAKGSKRIAVLVCFFSTVISFLLFELLDSCLSKKSFGSVLKAWLIQYQPERFHMPVTTGSITDSWELYVLLAMLLLGVYSFWWDKKKDRIKGWVCCVVILMAGECFGIFTTEVPVTTYLYLIFSVLAGIGVRECFRRVQPDIAYAVEQEKKPHVMQEMPGVEQEMSGTEHKMPGMEQEMQDVRDADSVEKTSGISSEENIPDKQDGREDRDVSEARNQPDAGMSLQEEKKFREKAVQESEQREESDRVGIVAVSPDTSEGVADSVEEEKTPAVNFIENPLPLPKKHVRRVADFAIGAGANDDYDYIVSDDDDFDID